MRKEENSFQFSAEYIRKYLDGELSDRDMQALEKAALEDPFLADAIEGIEESRKHAVSFESGIADLKTRLSERIHQRKLKTGILFQLSKWQVAASLIFVIGLAVFTVTYVNDKPRISNTTPHSDTTAVAIIKPSPKNIDRNDSTAVAVKKPSPENIDRNDSTAVAINKSSPGKSDSDDRIKRDEQIIASVKPQNEGKISVHKKEKASSQKADESSPQRNAGNALAAVPSKIVADTLQEAEKLEALAKKDVTAPLSGAAQGVRVEGYSGTDVKGMGGPSGNYIKGIVTDDKGMPIPFAKVNLQGTNRRVYTDTAGFFKLYMKDPRLAALVFVQPSGYESASVQMIADSNITHTIQLHSSAADADLKTIPEEKISPFVTGWDAFYHFIDSSKKINTKDSVMKGEEVISFTLYSDGRLSPFRIEESVSPAHDREILRLIPLAPALKLREEKRTRCVLRIEFK